MTNKQQAVLEQEAAINFLHTKYNQGKRILGLFGRAGTGKTTSVVELIKKLLIDNPRHQIAVCSVSHRAKEVIHAKFDDAHIPHAAFTVAALLKLRHTVNSKTGKVTYVYDSKRSLLNRYSIIIVDECSQINQEQYDILTQNLALKSCMIFTGDIYQTPPIDETNRLEKSVNDSPTFNIETKVFLETPYRYEGTIAELAEDIRLEIDKCNRSEKTDYSFFKHHLGKPHLQTFSDYSFVDYIISEFINGRLPPVIICYRNATVTHLNNLVRQKLYKGEQLDEFIQGEYVVSRTTTENFSIINMATYQIEKVKPTTASILISKTPIKNKPVCEVHLGKKLSELSQYSKFEWFDFEVSAYCMVVKDVETEQVIDNVYVLSEEGRKDYNEALFKLKKLSESTKNWDSFFNLKEKFVTLQHAYAINTYVVQGSTYREVLVDVKDITSVSLIDMKQKLQSLYTCVTRASHDVGLINIK